MAGAPSWTRRADSGPWVGHRRGNGPGPSLGGAPGLQVPAGVPASPLQTETVAGTVPETWPGSFWCQEVWGLQGFGASWRLYLWGRRDGCGPIAAHLALRGSCFTGRRQSRKTDLARGAGHYTFPWGSVTGWPGHDT